MRMVTSGGLRFRLQITVAPSAQSDAAASTVRLMPSSLTLPKMPDSSSTSAGSASAKLATRLASASRTRTWVRPEAAARSLASSAFVAFASMSKALTSARLGCPGSVPSTSWACPAHRLTSWDGPGRSVVERPAEVPDHPLEALAQGGGSIFIAAMPGHPVHDGFVAGGPEVRHLPSLRLEEFVPYGERRT